jgi:hypothetical protein
MATVLESAVGKLTEASKSAQIADIPELHGDRMILDLMADSTANNLQTVARILRYDMSVQDASAPPAAIEFARRLAQRGVSINAMTQSYRVGQRMVTTWLVDRVYE